MQLPQATRLPARNAWDIQRAVLVALVIRELRARVGGRWLGALWLVIEPLAHVMLTLVLFSTLRHIASPVAEAPVFLVTGLMPFLIFRNLVLRLTDAVVANRGLFGYRQVKPVDPLLARGVVEVGLFSAVYLLALAVLGWLGFQWLPRAPLELLAASAVLVFLAVSLGMVFAVATHNRPRVRTLIGFVFLLLYLLSGVIFNVRAVSPELREWLLWNPVLHFVDLSRYYFIDYYRPLPEVTLTYPLTCALVAAALGLTLYRLERFRLLITE